MSTNQIVATVIFILLILFETLFPFHAYLEKRVKHIGKNVIFSIANSVVTALFSAAITLPVFLYIERNEFGLLYWLDLSNPITYLLAFVILDGWLYFWHRFNHIIPFLWRFHQIHHSDRDMDVTTAFRFHPGETFFSSIINIFIILFFGITLYEMTIYKLILNANIYIHHSNIVLPERWDRLLRVMIVSPNMHKVHHSVKKEETDSNFASVFSFWDRIFGSYRRQDPKKITFGLDTFQSKDDQTVNELFTRPFKKSSS